MSIEVTINGKTCTVVPGATILDAAKKLGMEIPTLCYSHQNSTPGNHSSSCSVCLVYNETDNALVTACDTRIDKPVRISTCEKPEIIEGRKQSLELLVSEHTGDCIAPCVMACPFGIDIPELLKQAWTGFSVKGRELLSRYTGGGRLPCAGCSAPCIKVCRRKQIDKAVPVNEILFRLFETEKDNLNVSYEKPVRFNEYRFKSTTGRIKNNDEKRIQLENSLEKRYRAGYGAPAEGGTCLQCSCSARDNCELRTLADEYGAHSGTFKNGPREDISAPRFFGRLVFQAGKCIRCRRCENTAETRDIRPVPKVWFRGYNSVMSFGNADYDLHEAELLASACPTGALTVNDYDF